MRLQDSVERQLWARDYTYFWTGAGPLIKQDALSKELQRVRI